MGTIAYDDRSFLQDGSRIWLVSGEMHYFRIPAPLWADRLLKAKRAGLNCISTCIAWNFHEMREGQWDFSGDRDVVAFVRQAQQLGLYVIFRPGPYIGADWDFGGLPAWLAAKPGIAYRTNNAFYTHYFDKYFRQVLPRLAELQATRGGNIILIQNENDYVMTTMPDRLAYLEFINQLFRRGGFDIPIISRNGLTDPPVPDNIECVHVAGGAVRELKRLRRRQGGAPLLALECRSGGADAWGLPHQTLAAGETARRALEVLGCGAQYNYHMWHGGTNFAFWAGRHDQGEAQYQTPSYDCDAPLAEGGGLTEKYYLARLVNVMAQSLGPFFAAAAMDGPLVTVPSEVTALNVSGPLGRLAVVTGGGGEGAATARVSLPDGQEMAVSLSPLGATLVPCELRLTAEHTLDYANVMPLGFFNKRTLVFHGPAGWEAQVSVNRAKLRATIKAGDEPQVLAHQGLQVVLVSSALACRTWQVNGSLIFGPRFVGATIEDIVPAEGVNQYAVLAADGELTHKKVKAQPSRPAKVELKPWKRVSVCHEPDGEVELEWQSLDRPRDVDSLGAHYGYVWYRLAIEQEAAARRQLLLPNCEDRARLFLNDLPIGTWGRGPDATREPIEASFRKGGNVLTMLVDNLGRFSGGPRLGELKGLFGPVFDARPIKMGRCDLKPAEFAPRIVPRQLSHLTGELESLPVWSATIAVPLRKVVPLHLALAGLPHHAAVQCNGRMCGFFPLSGVNYGDITFSGELKQGKNLLTLLLWGDVKPAALEQVKLYTLDENLSRGATVGWRPWSAAPGEAHRGDGAPKGRPAWFASHFKHSAAGPLFVRIQGGARKGQLFLNGRNLGRFWAIGPQQSYYLPECWLAETNELLLFEESGLAPTGTRIEVRANCAL